MKRREFVALAASAAAWPLATRAQQAANMHRIGVLRFGPAAAFLDRVEALRAGLRQLSYVEGRNIVIEFRWGETVEELRALATELVRMNVDVIFATSSTEVEAARQATATIPIVFATHADPVGVGHVSSLAHPGGNITGLSMLLTEMVAKELEILKEALPRMTRAGVLFTSTAPSYGPTVQAMGMAGKTLGLDLVTVTARAPEEFDDAFATLARERAAGFLAVATPPTYSHRERLAALALKYRLPGIFGTKENVEAGGLMSYAPDLRDLTRQAAAYIDRILKGAKPADLPVEQASKYLLAINLKTARALGVDIPPTLLARADEVIE
jgi:putative ABC transport system substrate-binding protein